MSDYQKTDHLKEDPPLPGQLYAVVSFVNPTDHVLNKQLYYVNNFMLADINKQITAQAIQMVKKLSVDMRTRIADVLDKLKYSLDEEDKHMSRILEKHYRDMTIDEDTYVEECRRKYELDEVEMSDRFKMYLVENRTRLDQIYDKAHEDQTSLRGFKTRGNFSSMQEARNKAKQLRDEIEPGIHTFVVPVGTWFPVDMEADEAQDQDYMLPQLNELMGKYHESNTARNMYYQERKREMQEANAQNNQKTTKERLQEKLRQKKQEQIRKDIADLKAVSENKNEQPTEKKKRRHGKPHSTALPYTALRPDSKVSSEPASEPASKVSSDRSDLH